LVQIRAILVFILCALAQTNGSTFWIDDSCKVKKDEPEDIDYDGIFKKALFEAHQIAGRTADRLEELSEGPLPPPDSDTPGLLNFDILKLRFKGDFTKQDVQQKVLSRERT
jgi:hypothetical protein